MAEPLRKQAERRIATLENERSSFVQHWRDLSEFILPRQARFFVTERNRGNRRSTKIHDGTATLAAGVLSSGMHGGLTSPSRPWFHLKTKDPSQASQEIKIWLSDVRDRMSEVFLSSNLYTTLPQVYSDLGVFGVSSFLVEEDEEDVLRCYHFPIGSYSLGTSHRGVVDTFARRFQMTVAQLVGRFTKDKCSTAVQRAYDSGQYDNWFDVNHLVEPNPDHDAGKLESKFKAWRSLYWEPSNSDGFLSEMGFDSFPIMAPRWEVTGEDVYGSSCPGMVALADVQALQLEQKRKMEVISKQVNPPMNAPSMMRSAAASVLPGAINYVDVNSGQQGFTPAYQVQANLQHLLLDMQEVKQAIKRAFHEDLFLMLANIQHGQMTAQEVAERQQEKLLLLGPVLERLNDELFDPLIDRAFAIMVKRHLLPPPPPQLQGSDLNVEYSSIMAQAQKLQGISGVQQLVQFGGSLAAADPSILDKYDFDATVDAMASMLGTPPALIRDDKAVAAIRQQKAQQAQMQQKMAMAEQAANTGKTLADTNVTDPSMLTQMQAALRGLNGG